MSGSCCFHWTSATSRYLQHEVSPDLPVIRFNSKTLSGRWRCLMIGPPPHFEKPTMIGFGDSSPWFHYDQLSHFCLWHAADTAPWPAAESAACLSALEWDARNIIYAYAQTCDRIRASLDTCAHAPCYGTHGGVGQVNNLSLFLHTCSMHPWTYAHVWYNG